MKMKISAILLTLALLIACAGCGQNAEVTEATKPTEIPDTTQETRLEAPSEESTAPQTIPETTQAPAAFPDGLVGTFTLDTSGQFRSSICRMKQMDPDLMLFELDVMESSEGESQVSRYIIAGTMLLSGQEGLFESGPDAPDSLVLQFAFDEDRSGFTVTAPVDPNFTPAGHYTLTNDTIEASAALAIELVTQLPTAATGLSGNLGGYAVECAEELVSDWFYQVKAVLDDSGKTAASFLVPKDLSCVIRMDEDLEPTLIWGSADNLPDDSELEKISG